MPTGRKQPREARRKKRQNEQRRGHSGEQSGEHNASTPPRRRAGWGHDFAHLRLHLPTVPEALASLLRIVVVALFLLTFVLQPFLIPSESMERTLLVGDFLLFNKQVYAPAGKLTSWLVPYRDVARGDIVIFHHPEPPLLVKRVVGVPGDRLRIDDGRVFVNGTPLMSLTQPSSRRRPIPSATIFPPESTLTRRSIPTGGCRCRV